MGSQKQAEGQVTDLQEILMADVELWDGFRPDSQPDQLAFRGV